MEAALRHVIDRVGWKVRALGAAPPGCEGPPGPATSTDEWWDSADEAIRDPDLIGAFIFIPAFVHGRRAAGDKSQLLRTAELPLGPPRRTLVDDEAHDTAFENYAITKAARLASRVRELGAPATIVGSGPAEGSGPYVHPAAGELQRMGFTLSRRAMSTDTSAFLVADLPEIHERESSSPTRLSLDLAQALVALRRRSTRPPCEGPESRPRPPSQPVALRGDSADPWGPVAPIFLDAPNRPLLAPDAREIRARENAEALGGMRNPVGAVARVPALSDLGARVRAALLPHVGPGRPVAHLTVSLLAGDRVAPPSEGAIMELRAALADALSVAPPAPGSGLDPEIFDAIRGLGDPDPHVAGWPRRGAPLGIEGPVPSSGIFPVVPEAAPAGTLGDIVTHFDAFTNYSSAEEDPEVCLGLLRKMTERGWAVELPSLEEAQRFLGSQDLVFNRLALITKERQDGTVKRQLVWDLRRSGVNTFVSPGSESFFHGWGAW